MAVEKNVHWLRSREWRATGPDYVSGKESFRIIKYFCLCFSKNVVVNVVPFKLFSDFGWTYDLLWWITTISSLIGLIFTGHHFVLMQVARLNTVVSQKNKVKMKRGKNSNIPIQNEDVVCFFAGRDSLRYFKGFITVESSANIFFHSSCMVYLVLTSFFTPLVWSI